VVRMGSDTNRIEVEDLEGATTQLEPLVIEEHVPIVSGEHPALIGKDSLQVPIIDLRASGMVAIEDRVSEPVPRPLDANDSTAPLAMTRDEVDSMNAIAAINDRHLDSVIVEVSTDPTTKTRVPRDSSTTLGVAPLEPATVARAPFVAAAPANVKTEKTTGESEPPRHERTAMIALDPGSGMQRNGPWQALASVARSLRSARWWLRRRKTSRVKSIES
jgi:hypothetical protein